MPKELGLFNIINCFLLTDLQTRGVLYSHIHVHCIKKILSEWLMSHNSCQTYQDSLFKEGNVI